MSIRNEGGMIDCEKEIQGLRDMDSKFIFTIPIAPLLIFSALGNKNTQESMQKLGAEGFIEKPFEPEDLVKKIDNVLEARNG